jgi:hypothetical protein
MNKKFVRTITSVMKTFAITVFMVFCYSLTYSATSKQAAVIVRVGGDKVPPEKINTLVAQPRLTTGIYSGEEDGGWINLSWITPKDAEVIGVHNNEPVFSYLIKYSYTLTYDTSTYSGLMQWYDDAQRVFSNHIWYDPVQARGQTFDLYPYGFGIPSPEERYNLGFGGVDTIIVTGLQKGEKIYVAVASRDRYYNLSTPTIAETYVPASTVPPSKVTTLTTEYLGSGIVKLSWIAPSNDRYSIDSSSGIYNIPDGRYFIAYSTKMPTTFDFSPKEINSYWPEAKTVDISTSIVRLTSQSYNITGLTLLEDTTNVGYYFILWTSDEWYEKTNWSLPSNIARYGLVTPGYVRNISITSFASTDISSATYVKLSWTNPSDEDIPLSGIRIFYSTYTYTTNTNYITYITTIPNANCEITQTQLIPRLTYYYVLLAYNSMGSRPFTSEVIVKKYIGEDLIPPDAVTNLTGTDSASQENGSYITLTWTLPDENLYQNKDYYLDGRIEVNYSTTTTFDTKSVKILPPTTTTTNLTGLIPYTSYYIQLLTTDGGNNKSTSTVITVFVRYDAERPSKPEIFGFTVCASTDKTIGSYVKFDIQNPNDIDLKEVRMYYNTTGFTTSGNYIITTSSIHNNRYEQLSPYQLIPRVTYYFTFISVDQTNLFSTQQTKEVYIDKDVLSPDIPQNISIVTDANNDLGTYVNITFNPPNLSEYQNIDLENYEIYLSSKNVVPYLDNEAKHSITKNTNVTFSHLTPWVTYYITLHSCDPVGNKSTTTVYSIFAYKDIIPPKKPVVIISSYTISLDPDDGVVLKVKLQYPPDLDITNATLKLSEKQDFSSILDSRNSVAIPNNSEEFVFKKLDCDTTYYLKAEVRDRSNNSSFEIINILIPAPQKDDTVPLPPVSVKTEVKDNKLTFKWEKVRHQYNLSTYQTEILNYGNKLSKSFFVTKTLDIEKFKGVNNLGHEKPKTFEIYKYKIYYSPEIFLETNSDPQWNLIAQLTPYTTFYQTNYRPGYYKIVSYDITGQKDESLIVDTDNNYYLCTKSNLGTAYVKIQSLESQQIVSGKYYHIIEPNTDEIKGRILESFTPRLGSLNEQEGKIVYSPTYKFNTKENIVGVNYKVTDGKVKFNLALESQQNTSLKSIELEEENLENNVSFFVFDGKEYVRATTFVDKTKKLIYFKTAYLTKVQLRTVVNPNEFNFIDCKPRIITPDSSPGENDIAFFIFNNPKASEVVISIYDINSVKVNEIITREDSSTVGSYVGWNGKDFDNKYVRPGVYIYQVESEGKKFKGSIVVAR